MCAWLSSCSKHISLWICKYVFKPFYKQRTLLPIFSPHPGVTCCCRSFSFDKLCLSPVIGKSVHVHEPTVSGGEFLYCIYFSKLFCVPIKLPLSNPSLPPPHPPQVIGPSSWYWNEFDFCEVLKQVNSKKYFDQHCFLVCFEIPFLVQLYAPPILPPG